MESRNASFSLDSYAIAWIVTLPIENAAAEAILDEKHGIPTGFTKHQNDPNIYTWGRMGEHNLVIAWMTSELYETTTSASTTAPRLLASLPSIRVGLWVGIGGGVAQPAKRRDIRLGDVVVSQPRGRTGGICHYDKITTKSGDKYERRGSNGQPPAVLLDALTRIKINHERKGSNIPCFLQEMLDKYPKMGMRSKQNPGYAHQGFENDRLFRASCDHVPGPDCRNCATANEVLRDPRDSTDPVIHYGTVASSNTSVEDATTRDRIVADIGEDCISFEVEAANIMNHFPCLLIRGICNYADSHKNGQWQRYASATAAAYTKELLQYMPVKEVSETKRALWHLAQPQIDAMRQTTVPTKAATDRICHWLYHPDPSSDANRARRLRHEGTGAWLLESPVFQSWHSGSCRHLWLHGPEGCGKTVLSATMLDHLAEKTNGLILNFFFDFQDTTKQTIDSMLRSLAFQLYQSGVGSAVYLDALFQVHQNGNDQPTTKALSVIVVEMLAAQKHVSIILDALDGAKGREDILLWVNDVVSSSELGHVQLLCTSRSETEFLREIPRLIGTTSCVPLDRQAITYDIRSWIAAQLSQRRDFTEKSLSQSLLEEIQQKIGDSADGRFRWTSHQLDSLARCHHLAAMESVLASLSPN